MGTQAEMEATSAPSSHTKATFSGTTAFIGVLALIINIISVAVPHWGSYSPGGVSYFSSGLPSQDNTGHFGPFQVCKYYATYSYCGVKDLYSPSTWLIVGGICGIAAVLALAFFSLFSILHVAMQLQRREIWISFERAVFLKLVTSVLAVLANLGAVIFGAIEFSLSGRNNYLQYEIGICYFLQIFLIFVHILLVILSYLSYRRARRYPINLVPKGRDNGYVYDSNQHAHNPYNSNNGVSMTNTSGQPYMHGAPRNVHNYSLNAMTSYANGHTLPTVHFTTAASQPGPQTPSVAGSNGSNGGHFNNGFTAVGLHASGSPNSNGASPQNSMGHHGQPLPIQTMRPIQAVQPVQAVQGIPQTSAAPTITTSAPQPPPGTMNLANLPKVLPTGGSGVSFTPQGRGYSKMPAHMGSSESLESTQSTTLSIGSFGSSTSTGSAHGPLRSSLKKPKNKDIASVSSKSSSKQVRISLGAEQTQV